MVRTLLIFMLSFSAGEVESLRESTETRNEVDLAFKIKYRS